MILEIDPRIRTVARKASATGSLERIFDLEHLAGEQNYQVTTLVDKCQFRFDLSKVFWNTRARAPLRFVPCLTEDDVLCDLFAGCGPFSILAAKKHGCRVYANDINAHCISALVEAARLNKVSQHISSFNMDCRRFLPLLMEKITAWQHCQDNKQLSWPMFSHVVLHFPYNAIGFLDMFHGLLSSTPNLPLPMVHVYFLCRTEYRDDKVQEAREVLGVTSLGPEMDVDQLQSLSPGAHHYHLKFRLPAEVAFARPGAGE